MPLNFACRHRYPSGFDLDVAFDVDRRFTALFGPSGSGKTSILSMIAGFLRPNAGTIRLSERTLADTAADVWLPPEQRRVGIVCQDSLLFPHLTVEGNLRYGLRHRRRPRRAIEFSRVAEVLEIGPLLRRSARSLSGGERQRVALGRALLSSPEILLMDEPLASLDTPLRVKILAYLERVVAEWNLPTLYVTHAQAEVRRAAEWVVIIDKGRLVATGPPDEALSQPEPLAWAGSAAPINLLKLDSIESEAAHLTARLGEQRLFLPPGVGPASSPAFVQFSPKDVILSRQDVAGLSARNHLRGRVCKITVAGQARFVAIDVGQILWAELTLEAVDELDLQPGREVTCLIKAHSLSVVG
jgi:molybdate transport system ATP-binding protein